STRQGGRKKKLYCSWPNCWLRGVRRAWRGRGRARPDGRTRPSMGHGRLDVRRDRWPHGRPSRKRGSPLMRVCLYQRISTDEDHQPTSLKTQRSRPISSRTASAATVTGSKHSANEKPTSLPASPHSRTHHPTAPPSPRWSTNSKRSSPTRTPNKRKSYFGSSSRTSKYTTAAGSSPPTGFRGRFAQYLVRWS